MPPAKSPPPEPPVTPAAALADWVEVLFGSPRRMALTLSGLSIAAVGVLVLAGEASIFVGLAVLLLALALSLRETLKSQRRGTSRSEKKRIHARANLPLIACGLPFFIGLTAMVAISTGLLMSRGFEVTRGRPHEIRTEPYLRVWMSADAEPFKYDEPDRRGCSYDAQKLPASIGRWPQPRHVEIHHLGECIYGLSADGERWIYPAVSKGPQLARGVLAAIILAVLSASAGLALPATVRTARGFPKRRRKRRRS